MTETTNTPFSGLMVKAKSLPDLMYPRYQKWYNTSTYISTSVATYLGHPAAGGRNFAPTIIAERFWDQTNPPSRVLTTLSATAAMDITTPAYMLAGLQTTGQSTTEDTLIGLDYSNPPIRMFKDLSALQRHADLDTATRQDMFVRVLAIRHKITFVNHSRFPLEIYWAMLPVGHKFPDPTGQFAPHVDIMAQTYSKITVPAIRDAGDRGQKNSIDIDVNLKKLWPHEYDIAPGNNMAGADATAALDNANSPWMSTEPGSSAQAMISSFPPGQLATDAQSTPDFQLSGSTCGLRLQWFAKLQNPRDLGVTTEDADHAGGDYTGNNYDVHANMGWLCDIMRVGTNPAIHAGLLAYPSTAA